MILTAGAVSGAFRMIRDILERIDKTEFQMYVAYKPEFAEWGEAETNAIENSGAILVPLKGKKLFDIRGYWDLWRALCRERIDALHCWDVLGVPARPIGKLAGARIIVEFPNPPPVKKTEISIKHFYLNYLSSIFVDGYITCSNEAMRRYREQRPVILGKKRFAAICNCVDVSETKIDGNQIRQINNEYLLEDGEQVLTNIGYFNAQKAQDDLLRAFEIIAEKRDNVRLFIVGWGPLENKLRQIARDKGLSDKVVFTGKLPRKRIFELLSITDIFVLSSLWEGFGIVLAEAMALGKPVITTDTDGGREVVEHGKTGIIVPPGNPQVMSEKTLWLLDRPETMREMGAAGFERVVRLFDCKRYIREYENFYRSIL